jgi:HNH endonuclease/NUMOD4 motif
MKEQWKEIFDGYYEVSSLGRIRRIKGGPGARVGHFLKPGVGKKGYLGVGLCVLGVVYQRYLHKLVIEAFKGPCPPRKEVNHKDGIKKHCELSNLEYLTKSKNHIHASKLGLRNSKLTVDKVKEIRRFRKEGMRVVDMVKRFEVTAGTLQNIFTRKTWGHIR